MPDRLWEELIAFFLTQSRKEKLWSVFARTQIEPRPELVEGGGTSEDRFNIPIRAYCPPLR